MGRQYHAPTLNEFQEEPGEQDANARLIAAAPSMLAALEGFAAWEAADSPMSDDDLRALFEQARAAVAQATGKEPQS